MMKNNHDAPCLVLIIRLPHTLLLYFFLMQIFIGNNKIKLQFIVLHLKNKVTVILAN